MPGRSWWRTTRLCVAGVRVAKLTTLGTWPVSLNVRMIRTALEQRHLARIIESGRVMFVTDADRPDVERVVDWQAGVGHQVVS